MQDAQLKEWREVASDLRAFGVRLYRALLAAVVVLYTVLAVPRVFAIAVARPYAELPSDVLTVALIEAALVGFAVLTWPRSSPRPRGRAQAQTAHEATMGFAADATYEAGSARR